MKKLLILTLSIAGAICLSCCSRAHYRSVDDIFDDVLAEYTNPTDSGRFIALMNEYADSLYSEIVNSPLNNIDQRAMAQKRAGDALSICLEYLSEPSPLISGLLEKLDKVNTTWRTVSGDPERPGCSYIKEIFYIAGKETDQESEEVMNIVIWTGEAPQSLVIIPEGDENAQLIAAFCNRAPEGSDQFIDFDGGVLLDPDFLSYEDGPRCYGFQGNEFFRQMMSHDHLFVLYTIGEEGQYESVMVNLDRFHEQASESLAANRQ